jgi:hypothetical protein
MQISNIAAGYSDPATIGKRAEQLEGLATRVMKSVDSHVKSALGGKSAAAAILSDYDVTRISPNEFSEMIQKLYQAGAITESDYQSLSGIRADLETAGVQGDDSVNLIDFYTRKVNELQQKAESGEEQEDRQLLAAATGRLDWVQKFALIQANPSSVGLDAVA